MLLVTPFRGGIILSEDEGKNWEKVDRGFKNATISLIAASTDPDSRTLYASSVSGEGVFKTDNLGATWANITDNGISHFWGDELVVSPHDPLDVWYIADVGKVDRSLDGGESWINIFNTYGPGFTFGSVYAMAVAPSDPRRLYAAKSGFGIFRSENRGGDWRFCRESEIDYTYTLAVHPQNPDIVFSGYNPKPFEDWAMIRGSRDGGRTWTTSLEIPGSTGVTSVAFSPGNPDLLYAGSTGKGGAVWKSGDGGENWTVPNTAFDFTNIHSFTSDPANPLKAYAGTWGGGTWITENAGTT